MCSQRHLADVEPGVHPIEVDHADNRTRSAEEVDRVIALVGQLLSSTWTDEHGNSAPLGTAGILVVAPFNLQVSALRTGLDRAGHTGIQVGTVDKFPGRQAPVVIVSLAASSGDDLPRGIEFLLSRNRLNVAVSRAQWAAFVVHSPRLRQIQATTVDAMIALGAFLGVLSGGESSRSVMHPVG